MTLLQPPNKILMVALAALALGYLADGFAYSLARAVFYTAISIWSYAELTTGINWFRRGLGAVVIIYTLSSLAAALP